MEVHEMHDDAKKKTFFKLLKEYNIKIPIIQRDYAQGRQNEKANAVRKSIIQALKNSLENNTNLDLNFVYGTVQKADDILTFFPVDGQQRLTTLYLLYYYFFVVNGKIEDFNKQCKSFTYATRTSATEFFSWLREGSKEVMNALASEGNDLKNIICNMPSYQVAWNNDPTVISAITMLAAIKESVGKAFAEKFYGRLIDEECPISFSVIIEEAKENAEMNADKAYIRMNARGKTLEDFENLRSMIDGIDKEKVNIIRNYDQIYLDKIYNACRCYNTLKAITQNMNQKSYAAFMNIYNIVALSFGGIDFKNNEVEYRNYMYECSKRTQDLKDTTLLTLNVYIDVLDTYFEYCTSLETFEYNNCIFCKNRIQKNINNEDKNVITEVLYCYFYKKQKGKVATKRQVEDFIYVLDNLALKEWTNFYVNIKIFCEKVAEYNDVFEFFLNVDIEHRDETLEVGISDLSVRLKEQAIKTALIQYEIDNGNANNVDYRYFEQFERLCPERKLQFFLYITECWEKLSLNSETFNHFIRNLNKGKKWFLNEKTEELEFLKLYAIAANMDEANQLAEPDTVNKNCTRNSHIWKRSVCFWSDEDEYNPELSSKWKEKCALAKKTYCMEEHYFMTAKKTLLQSKYNHCWLKYAVMYNYKELIEHTLGLDEKNNVIINLDEGRKKYLMYVYILKNNNIIGWGEKEIMKSNIIKRKIPYGDILLPISKKLVKVEDTFNATLQWKTFLTIQDKKGVDKEDCMYLIEDDTSVNTYVYKRFIFQYDNPSELLLEEYDIIEDVNNLNNEHELESEKVNNFGLNEFLELYEEAYTGQTYQSSRITADYHRGQGNSRTWTREKQIISYVKAKTSKVQI